MHSLRYYTEIDNQEQENLAIVMKESILKKQAPRIHQLPVPPKTNSLI